MKILVIHNHYQQPGGEDVVFDLESALLEESETVKRLTFQNKTGWRGFGQTVWSIWNIFAASRIKRTIQSFQPDVIHLHNFHYALGPVGIRIAKKKNIPIVVTLHNYRIICPSATLFYNGHLFTESLNTSFPWKAILLGVHSHSVLKTAWLAFTNWFHKKIGTWKQVSKYIVLSEFAKHTFTHSTIGIKETAFIIKPNFVYAEHASQPEIPQTKKGIYLYVGRLSEEKGIYPLLKAFEENGRTLQIVGDGPLRSLVKESCASFENIQYLGMVDRKDIPRIMHRCSALIFPSICYEGMPLTVLEAFACGTAVIASNLGALPFLITHNTTGLLFDPGNIRALNEQIDTWENMDQEQKDKIRSNATQVYEDYYTPQKNKEQLLTIYRDAIATAIS